MPPAKKSVLISLADNANDEGVCWPSIRHICERTCLSERAVQLAVRWLMAHGALAIRSRNGRSTVFSVSPASYVPPHGLHPTPAPDAPPPPHQMHPGGARAAPITVIEPPVEPNPPSVGVNGTAVDLLGAVPVNGQPKGPPPCPASAIVASFHKHLPMAPRVAVWTPSRHRTLTLRWREDPERQNIGWWDKLFEYCATSEFLTGRSPPAKDRQPFVVTIDWLLKPANLVKVIEGNYA